jgi:hypothetical protein
VTSTCTIGVTIQSEERSDDIIKDNTSAWTRNIVTSTCTIGVTIQSEERSDDIIKDKTSQVKPAKTNQPF